MMVNHHGFPMTKTPLEGQFGGVPSGKLTKNDGKSPFFMGKSTISMAMFNSFLYVYQRVTPPFQSHPSTSSRRLKWRERFDKTSHTTRHGSWNGVWTTGGTATKYGGFTQKNYRVSRYPLVISQLAKWRSHHVLAGKIHHFHWAMAFFCRKVFDITRSGSFWRLTICSFRWFESRVQPGGKANDKP